MVNPYADFLMEVFCAGRLEHLLPRAKSCAAGYECVPVGTGDSLEVICGTNLKSAGFYHLADKKSVSRHEVGRYEIGQGYTVRSVYFTHTISDTTQLPL